MTADNNKRLESFMNFALSRTSTISEPNSDIATQDIAFAVDYLNILPGQVEELKREIIQKTPIMAMVYTLTTIQTESIVGETIRVLSTFTDSQARVYLMKKLYYLENILFASTTAKIDTDNYRTRIWRVFTSDLNDPLRKLPSNVSSQIQNSIIKQRCGVDPTFLNETDKKLIDFNDIFNDGQSSADHPLNSKNRLCPVIRDLNTMADTGLKNKIHKRVKLLNRYTPGELGLTSDSVEYKTIKKDVDTFKRWVLQWENTDSYACKTENCVTHATRLKEAATEVRKYANTCTSSVELRRKNNLRRRKKCGERLTLRENISTWF
jgi:hypothetical protein